jgi:hypothetical protein
MIDFASYLLLRSGSESYSHYKSLIFTLFIRSVKRLHSLWVFSVISGRLSANA